MAQSTNAETGVGARKARSQNSIAVQSVLVRSSTVNAAILIALIIAVLYVGKTVFMPMAAAILLAFVLAPIVAMLRRMYVPRIPAVLLVVVATFASLFAVGSLITSQLKSLAEDIPRYEHTLRDKVRDLRGAAISSPAIERAAETLKQLQDELEKPNAQNSGDANRSASGDSQSQSDALQVKRRRLVPVEVHYPEPKPLDSLLSVLATLIEPIAMLTIVIVLVMFILIQKQDLRDRFIRLAGPTDMQRTTAAMTDAADRLSRFLLNLTVLNIVYGAVMSAALWWLGVPAPILWGILAALMRFVPILGSFIAAAFPIMLAAAVDPGWTTVLTTIGLYVVGESVMGQIVEPLIQGKSTGLSPLAILVAAAFWTLLWGPVGLLLAIPMTLCLVVLGQHVERLGFIHVLLGDEPALSPAERFYQRSLAGDAAEVSEFAEKHVAKAPLSVFYRDVAIEGLRLAQIDADRGSLDRGNMETIEETTEAMVDNIWELTDEVPAGVSEGAGADAVDGEVGRAGDLGTSINSVHGSADLPVLMPADLSEGWRGQRAVICVPAKSPIDRAAAHLLAHVIDRHGVHADVVDRSALLRADQGEVDASATHIVCICSLSEQLSHARFLARRISRRFPQMRIVVALWGASDDQRQVFAVSETAVVDRVTGSIRDAVSEVVVRAASAAEQGSTVEHDMLESGREGRDERGAGGRDISEPATIT